MHAQHKPIELYFLSFNQFNQAIECKSIIFVYFICIFSDFIPLCALFVSQLTVLMKENRHKTMVNDDPYAIESYNK